MSGPRAPNSLRHKPQSTPLKFEEPDYHAAALRVGAHWCAIGSADVTYDLLEGFVMSATVSAATLERGSASKRR